MANWLIVREGSLPPVSLSTTHRMTTVNYHQLQAAAAGTSTKRKRRS